MPLRPTRPAALAALAALVFAALAGPPARAQPSGEGGGEAKGAQSIGNIILRDETANQVLDLLEQITGKIILRRQDMPSTKINFNSRGPLTRDEAVRALKSLLTLNGVMLTELGGPFMKAVPAANTNSHAPRMISGSTLDRPASQQIYSKLFRLKYLGAKEATSSLISPLLSQNRGSPVVFAQSNAVLVTDALVNLQRIERLLNDADRPPQLRGEMRFVELDYVPAEKMSERLSELISGPLKTYLEGNTTVDADKRTNQLIVISPEENFEILKNVVDQLDVDAAPLTRTEVFQLRQAKAEDVVSIIRDVIEGQEEAREEDEGGERGGRERREGRQGGGGDGGGQQEPQQGGGQGGQRGRQGGAPSGTRRAIAEGLDREAALQFSKFVGLSADTRTNSIVAFGTDSDIKTIGELVEKIDIPLQQVRIEAIITEVSLSENQASGITSLGFTLDEDGELSFGGEDGGGSGNGNGGGIQASNGGIFGSGFSFTGNVDGLVNGVLSAAESNSNVRVLSTPTIVVSHNEEGVVNVSESRPIITSSTSSGVSDNLNTRSNVEFRDIGIQLTVTPLIGADGSVQMDIEQTVDNVADTTTIDGNTQPIIGRREATSTITVNSGEVIILGGLQENRRSENNAFFPFLGRMPLLKNVFGGDTTDYTRTELIIFIRPNVLQTPDQSSAMTDEKLEAITEGDAVMNYLETGSTGRLYMEGSVFETPAPEERGTDGAAAGPGDATSGETGDANDASASDPPDESSPRDRYRHRRGPRF